MQRRSKRQSSNIFHMLGKNQIVELRETFNILDENNDGIITKEDLETFLNSIGSPYSENEIEEMMLEMGDGFSFMTFITVISEKLSHTDNEKDICRALSEFQDPDYFREICTTGDNKFSNSDVDILLRGCIEDGVINKNLLAKKIKYGEIILE